jgi:hypothetical protein
MNIQYYGDFCFKITTKPGGRATDDIVIVIDPCEKDTGLRAPQGQIDLVLKTHSSEKDRDLPEETNLFDCPGEYDVRGIPIFGLPSFRDEESGALRGKNTLFTLQSEDIVLCHLGALGHELSLNTIEKLGHIDILFVPVGNKDTLAIKHLDELVRKIEPAIVIPMHYKFPGFETESEDEKEFCKHVGNCPETSLPKLTLKKKDLEGKNMEVVLLERA